MEEKRRIGYIDAMRGITMILVVFAHIETFSYGIRGGENIVGNIFLTFRMPMFFFISGFLSYKLNSLWTTSFYTSRLKKKALIQIIPTLIFFHVYACIWHGNAWDTFAVNGPGGYWFTIVLFEMFIIYYTVMYLCRNSNSKTSDFILIIISLIGVGIYLGGTKFYKLDAIPVLCLINLSRYFEFFVFGTLCRKYEKEIHTIIRKEWFKGFILTTFFILFTLGYNKYIINYSILHVLNLEVFVRWAGFLCFYSIIYYYRSYFEKENTLNRTIKFIGTRTLDIYLLHYFFIPNLKFLAPYFSNNNNIPIEIVTTLIISLIIIGLTLLLSLVIRHSHFLGQYLLGAKYNS